MEMDKYSHKHTPETASHTSGSCYSCSVGTNSKLALLDIEWHVIKALVGVMYRCPITFADIVLLFLTEILTEIEKKLQSCTRQLHENCFCFFCFFTSKQQVSFEQKREINFGYRTHVDLLIHCS